MNLKNRLSKLEQTKRKIATEAACICFPPNEPPKLLLQAERDAASGVLCPVHGERFSSFARQLIYGEIIHPLHLDPNWRTRHSPQYVKAMDATFPSDRWPPRKIVEPHGTVRLVLKDGTEIHRWPPVPIYDYDSGELAGFLEGDPPEFQDHRDLVREFNERSEDEQEFFCIHGCWPENAASELPYREEFTARGRQRPELPAQSGGGARDRVTSTREAP